MDSRPVLLKMLRTEKYSDLQFSCRGRIINVHKGVVCVQSPIIEARVKVKSERPIKVIEMDRFSVGTVFRFVQYLYTGDYHYSMPAAVATATANAPVKRSASPVHTAAIANIPRAVQNRVDDRFESVTPMPDAPNTAIKSDRDTPRFIILPDPAADRKVPAAPIEHEIRLTPHIESVPAHLQIHINLNAIGDYFGVDALVTLANKKIEDLLAASPRSLVTCLPAAVEHAAPITYDKAIISIFSRAMAKDVTALLDSRQLEAERNFMSEFGVQILRDTASTLEARIREQSDRDRASWTPKAEADALKRKLNKVLGCVHNLEGARKCRNSRCASTSFVIDTDAMAVRCRQCRSKH